MDESANEALLEAALRHASQDRGSALFKSRPDLGADIVTWHVRNSVFRSAAARVRHPRHILYCRWENEGLAVGRVLGDVMESELHITPDMDWE